MALPVSMPTPRPLPKREGVPATSGLRWSTRPLRAAGVAPDGPLRERRPSGCQWAYGRRIWAASCYDFLLSRFSGPWRPGGRHLLMIRQSQGRHAPKSTAQRLCESVNLIRLAIRVHAQFVHFDTRWDDIHTPRHAKIRLNTPFLCGTDALCGKNAL